jgi:hypothetical protein
MALVRTFHHLMARTRDELLEMLDELIRPSDPILVYGRQQL